MNEITQPLSIRFKNDTGCGHSWGFQRIQLRLLPTLSKTSTRLLIVLNSTAPILEICRIRHQWGQTIAFATLA